MSSVWLDNILKFIFFFFTGRSHVTFCRKFKLKWVVRFLPIHGEKKEKKKKDFHRFFSPFFLSLALHLFRLPSLPLSFIFALLILFCDLLSVKLFILYMENEHKLLRGWQVCVCVWENSVSTSSLIVYRQENVTVKIFNAREAGNEGETCMQENNWAKLIAC